MRFREIVEVKPNERLVYKRRSNMDFDPDKRIEVDNKTETVSQDTNIYDPDKRIVVPKQKYFHF